MSSEDKDRAVAGLRRFYRARGAERLVDEALLARGRTARVLAASKQSGLLLNVEAPELTFFIADGMDITSQLVSVMSDSNVHAALKESLRDDIRISVHAQHPVEFLGDVRDHRFDLITIGELDPSAARLAAAGLAPGGLLAVFPRATAHGGDAGGLEQMLEECGMMISTAADRVLLAARTPDHHTTRRRGGRRKRPPARG